MKFFKPILIVMLLLALSVTASKTFAGGPGFDNDVYTWGSNNDDDDGNSHGDDDGYGCGDDDQWDDDDDDDVYDDEGNEIPLDGGIGFLAAAGAAFGVKRVRDMQNKKKEEK